MSDPISNADMLNVYSELFLCFVQQINVTVREKIYNLKFQSYFLTNCF